MLEVMSALTAATVTDQQIRDLRAEAVQAGDWRQVDVCDVALGKRPQHTATGRGSIKDSSGRSMTRAKARSACSRVISYTQGEAGHGAAPSRHHATKKSPAQLQREINEELAKGAAPHRVARRAAWTTTLPHDEVVSGLLEHDQSRLPPDKKVHLHYHWAFGKTGKTPAWTMTLPHGEMRSGLLRGAQQLPSDAKVHVHYHWAYGRVPRN